MSEALKLAEEAKWLVNEVIDDFYQGTLREHQLTAAIDRLAALASQAESEARDAAWQPMSTAPKDGTWILLAGPDQTGAQRMVCRWTNFMEWESADDGYGAYIQPTHWQPLPAPPLAEKEQTR